MKWYKFSETVHYDEYPKCNSNIEWSQLFSISHFRLIILNYSEFVFFSGLLTQVESWEERAKACLSVKPRLSLNEIDKLIKDGDAISEALPTLQTLKDSHKKAKEW